MIFSDRKPVWAGVSMAQLAFRIVSISAIASFLLAATVGGQPPVLQRNPLGELLTEQVHVPPTLLPGSLYVGTARELSPRQSMLLEREIGKEPQTLVVIGAAPQHLAEACPASLLRVQWRSIAVHRLAAADDAHTRARLAADLARLSEGCCVWLCERELQASSDAFRGWLGEQLADCFSRDVTVCLARQPQPAPAAASARDSRTFAAGLSLLPSFHLVCDTHAQPAESVVSADQGNPAAEQRQSHFDDTARAEICLAENSWLRVRGRELWNLSESNELAVVVPATEHYPDELVERLPPLTACDLVAIRRAVHERRLPVFPGDEAYDHRLSGGSLVIVGGGATPPEIWQKFVKLAGGDSARIVVLPTAVAEPEEDASEARIFERLGVQHVQVLPQIDRAQVSSPEYLAQLRAATGVWFGGGRQWRFVDAYWATPAWQAILDVARRGGVIGGSSAGATIQGDLLVRGHPLGNHIMVADGYRRGLGLLPGVAIDQHFRQRNRFADLSRVVERFPTVLGIGIDEATALVVEAPDKCSVIGEGNVWLSTSQPGPEPFLKRPAGSAFLLSRP